MTMKLFLSLPSLRRALFRLGAVAVLPALAVSAQDFKRIAPQLPPTHAPAASLGVRLDQATGLPQEQGTEPGTGPNPGLDEKLLDTLNGVILVDGPKAVPSSGQEKTRGIHIRGIRIEPPLKVPDEAGLVTLLSPWLGKPLTQGDVNEMLRQMVLFYRKNDRPVVDIYVPEQDVTAGVIRLVVLEGRVGTVKVKENRWFSARETEQEMRMGHGDLIRAHVLMEDLDWINRNPFKSADAIFAPGSAPGETDIIVKAKDRFPLRVYSGYDNSGNDLTGDNRWNEGFNWGDAFQRGDQLNFQYTLNNNANLFRAYSGSYVTQLPWRHVATLFGSYSASDAGTSGNVIQIHGQSWQVGGRYEVPLPRLGDLRHGLTGGFDFKETNNGLDFNQTLVSETSVNVNQFSLSYTVSLPDAWGQTSATATGFWSPGGLGGNNTDAAFNSLRTEATACYAYGHFQAERVTKLPFDFSLILRGTWQVADENLLPSEQLSVGGYDSVRGYEEQEASGDKGYLFSAEIRTPSVSPGKILGLAKANDQMQFLGFWDRGETGNEHLLSGETRVYELASAGAGTRYAIGPWLSARFDYGFQLLAPPGLTSRFGSRGEIGVTLSY